jgi:cysteine sulfinate desulfinase/cysteine desulfurase-like protein
MFEFLIIILIMLFILAFAILFKEQRTEQVSQTELYNNANSLCEQLSSSIDSVYAAGSGSGVNVTLPQKIQSKDYSFKVSSGKILVLAYSNQNIFCSFKAEVSNGTASAFELSKGKLSIVNEEGVVVLS